MTKITPDKTLTPVVIEFKRGAEFDGLPKAQMSQTEPYICQAIGFIESDDGPFIRLINRVEHDDGGTAESEQGGFVIPKENIIEMGRPFDVEVIDYYDHATFNYHDAKDLPRLVPWKCTVYGRIQEENDDFIRIIVFEEFWSLYDTPKQGGMVILKSAIISRETFRATKQEKQRG